MDYRPYMVKLDRIYTRGGDAGETSLGDGERVSKDSSRIWAYGSVDELGAAIGVARTSGLQPWADDLLRRIQNDLFDVGADLSVPMDTQRGHGKSRLRITSEHVTALELACDEQSEALAPLTSFVLSGGTPAAAHLHSARTVCRRAERLTVAPGRRGTGQLAGDRLSQPAFRPVCSSSPAATTTTAARTCCGSREHRSRPIRDHRSDRASILSADGDRPSA